MAAFQYEAMESDGTARHGMVESDSIRQARSALRESGLIVVSIFPVAGAALPSSGSGRSLFGFGKSLSVAQVSQLTRQLAVLLAAGLSLEQSLTVLIEQSDNETARQVFAGIRAEVLAGNSLAQAFARYDAVFPSFYTALVQAGEASGELGQVMLKLADYTDARHALRQKVALAFVYPVIVTLVAILVVGGLLVFVVPQVVQVFQQSRQELPLLTSLLIGFSDAVQVAWPYLLVLTAAAILAFRKLLAVEAMRFRFHQWLLRLPVIGKLLRGIHTERIASTLAILVGSGVPLLTALHNAARTTHNLPMRRAVEEAAAKVREGVTLSRSLAASGLFPPLLIHLIASGEASGKLEVMLERAAKQQAQEVDNFTSVLTSLLEPLLVLTMGGVVLLIVLAILLPIIDLNQMVH